MTRTSHVVGWTALLAVLFRLLHFPWRPDFLAALSFGSGAENLPEEVSFVKGFSLDTPTPAIKSLFLDSEKSVPSLDSRRGASEPFDLASIAVAVLNNTHFVEAVRAGKSSTGSSGSSSWAQQSLQDLGRMVEPVYMPPREEYRMRIDRSHVFFLVVQKMSETSSLEDEYRDDVYFNFSSTELPVEGGWPSDVATGSEEDIMSFLNRSHDAMNADQLNVTEFMRRIPQPKPREPLAYIQIPEGSEIRSLTSTGEAQGVPSMVFVLVDTPTFEERWKEIPDVQMCKPREWVYLTGDEPSTPFVESGAALKRNSTASGDRKKQTQGGALELECGSLRKQRIQKIETLSVFVYDKNMVFLEKVPLHLPFTPRSFTAVVDQPLPQSSRASAQRGTPIVRFIAIGNATDAFFQFELKDRGDSTFLDRRFDIVYRGEVPTERCPVTELLDAAKGTHAGGVYESGGAGHWFRRWTGYSRQDNSSMAHRISAGGVEQQKETSTSQPRSSRRRLSRQKNVLSSEEVDPPHHLAGPGRIVGHSSLLLTISTFGSPTFLRYRRRIRESPKTEMKRQRKTKYSEEWLREASEAEARTWRAPSGFEPVYTCDGFWSLEDFVSGPVDVVSLMPLTPPSASPRHLRSSVDVPSEAGREEVEPDSTGEGGVEGGDEDQDEVGEGESVSEVLGKMVRHFAPKTRSDEEEERAESPGADEDNNEGSDDLHIPSHELPTATANETGAIPMTPEENMNTSSVGDIDAAQRGRYRKKSRVPRGTPAAAVLLISGRTWAWRYRLVLWDDFVGEPELPWSHERLYMMEGDIEGKNRRFVDRDAPPWLSNEGLLMILSSLMGFAYVVLWLVGLLLQFIHNWRRNSVDGYSFDKNVYNLVGYTAYSVYTIASMAIEKALHMTITVEWADIFFAVLALLITIAIEVQIVLHIRRIGGYACLPLEQRHWTLTAVLCGGMVFTLGLHCTLAAFGYMPWITLTPVEVDDDPGEGSAGSQFAYSVMSYLGYLKVLSTLLKHLPQVVLNQALKSTKGNLPKLSLSIVCIGWNILLVAQHLYHMRFTSTRTAEGEAGTELSGSQGGKAAGVLGTASFPPVEKPNGEVEEVTDERAPLVGPSNSENTEN
uniref:Intimal thickness related receptor IRP domain-containing protein n=1 Tax=Chromera velia CCMP2878 TaxID=1169474 RepID=A0A0G4HRW4_9ALVE|eukprot:Cvel_8175.t1-p1 / transcript=Cvel_8175.t1 / gene=Cvel_8175 / organism=Chromera_velia_CCMP2878 / gene_product=Cystinosin, putative / transcript_product=Cystinosin, putative / location=Cvel_scaffold445:63030-68029(-) / protein_length=1115 / sequence_SO=supercontig / SO=protein_coding / is_pseudo=false